MSQPESNPARAADRAVILAAGDGTRIQPSTGEVVSKPLVRLFGQHLLERGILTLAHAGIRRFRIVVGAHHERVRETISALPHLAHLDIEFTMSPEYRQGLGYSLAAGARGIEESFLLTMADHVFEPATVRAFLDRATEHPTWPQLCTSPDVEGTFDIDDATKVLAEGGIIRAIGKELDVYNEIDMGLFLFPAGYGARIVEAIDSGARSISDILMYNREHGHFHTTPMADAIWYDVDTPAAFTEAERHLQPVPLPPAR